jgi:hypothetical protein
MSERTIGAELRRQMERLSGRVEVLEAAAARAEGRTIDWQKVDDGRIDLDASFDSLNDDVQRAIEAAFGRLADAFRRKFAEA